MPVVGRLLFIVGNDLGYDELGFLPFIDVVEAAIPFGDPS
jgi:hypothetical protein